MKTKQVTMIGMGIALFVALSMCLRVPVFENYYLCLGYVVMMVYCWCFGAIPGTLVGTVGTFLYCLLINGLRGMPGWVIANVIIGIGLTVVFKVGKKLPVILSTTFYFLGIVIVTAIAILCVKSAIEMILYAQPFLARVMQNSYAFVADVAVLTVSLPICKQLYPIIKNTVTKG